MLFDSLKNSFLTKKKKKMNILIVFKNGYIDDKRRYYKW